MNDMIDVGTLDRSQYLGSSDIAAIMGLSPWKSPVDVWFEKRGQPQPIDGDKERLFKRGKRLEPIVLDMLADEQAIEYCERGARYRDTERPWMAAEIDAEMVDFSGNRVNIEVKTVHPFAADKWGEAGTDEIPIHYAAQAMYGLMVTGRQRCIFAALFGADNLVTYEISRDEETIAGIRAKAIAFWHDHVLTGIAPEPIVIEDIYRLLKRDVETIVEAPPDVARLIAAFEEAKYRAKSMAEHADELKFQIGKWLLGAATMEIPTRQPKHVIVSGGSPLLTVSYQEQNRIDSTRLRTRYAAIATECSKTSSFFRFDSPRKGKTR